MFLTFAERVEGQRTTSSSSTAGQGLVSKRQLIAFGPDIDVEIWLYLEHFGTQMSWRIQGAIQVWWVWCRYIFDPHSPFQHETVGFDRDFSRFPAAWIPGRYLCAPLLQGPYSCPSQQHGSQIAPWHVEGIKICRGSSPWCFRGV